MPRTTVNSPAETEGKMHMQQVSNWRYYNHAIIPTTAPHEAVDESIFKSRSLWKSVGGHPVLIRWTTDFDCPENTCWWFILKDKPFDFMDVTSNYRQKIRRGLKSFEVRVIEPDDYAKELYQVQVDAFSAYPLKYRPKVDYDRFVASLSEWTDGITFAAFNKEDGSLAGYAYVVVNKDYLTLSVLKARPSEEKKHVNAAVVFSVLDHYSKELAQGVYITSGERNILHETRCQEYLEKYFGFRRAYCQMHIMYRQGIRQIVACLYLMRGLLKHLDGFKCFFKINGVLKMEEINRKCSRHCCLLDEER